MQPGVTIVVPADAYAAAACSPPRTPLTSIRRRPADAYPAACPAPAYATAAPSRKIVITSAARDLLSAEASIIRLRAEQQIPHRSEQIDFCHPLA